VVLANSVFRSSPAGPTDKIVFLSPTRRAPSPAAMVYVPGASFRGGTMGYSSSTYLRFKEVREQPRVSFSSRDRVRSEAVSRRLAVAIVKALKKADLPTQPYQPIRERIIRGAVFLRRTPGTPSWGRVLVEMVNLNNPDDGPLGRAAERDHLKAIAGALDYFAARRAGPRPLSRRVS
jgi:hypothetical protein